MTSTAINDVTELSNEVLQNAAILMLQKGKFTIATKSLDKDDMLRLSGFINSRLEKIEAEHQKMLEERAEEKALADKIKKALEEKGMTLEDVNLLTGGDVKKSKLTKSGSPRKPVLPKYAGKDSDGNDVSWSGRGKQPIWVKEHIEQGGSIEDLLIEQGEMEKAS